MVEGLLVRARKNSEGIREGKGDHEMRHRQEQSLLVFQPRLGLVILALRTVPILAGVVAVMVLLTRLTGQEVATESFSAARLNVLHGPQMRGRHPVAKLRAVLGAVDAEDVSYLYHHRSLMKRHVITLLRSAVS